MRPAPLLVLVVLAGALLGCGQKGNLYLPNQKKKVPAPPTQGTQAQPQTTPLPEGRTPPAGP